MKISPISPTLNNLPSIYILEKPKSQNECIQKSESGFPSQNVLSLYSKAAHIPFGQTKPEFLNFEYFGLHRGARPDEYQLEAARKLSNGESLLVCAPTGTGKTAIAKFIMSKNLKEGKRTFYTTPLKALSNQKLLEFRKIYGEENVGIITGDRKENAKAPILVMTTEVYRNMAFDQHFNKIKHISDDVKTIIFDEFHYLGDVERGNTWEESVMFSPLKMQILGLSATIGNDEEITSWLKGVKRETPVTLIHVPSEARHVPLRFYKYSTRHQRLEPYSSHVYGSDISNYEQAKTSGELTDFQKYFANMLNKEMPPISGMKLDKRYPHSRHNLKPTIIKIKSRSNVDDFSFLVNMLNNQDKLPAIFFVFSKKSCNNYVDALKNSPYVGDLTTKAEKEQIISTLKKYRDKYKYIGSGFNYQALLKGYAVHHAGIMPVEKEIIEDLFKNKLIKVVFATETLAAGINMPARTVVITSPEKPFNTPEGTYAARLLSANEYHQMAGRAGRRGIDAEGFVVNMSANSDEGIFFEELVCTSSNPIASRFEPSYSLIANYHRHNATADEVNEIFSKSFKIHSADEKKKKAKLSDMQRQYYAKAHIMEEEGYLEKSARNTFALTGKGELMQNIHGYPQIPLINLITSHALKGLSPEELVLLAGSIVCGDFTQQQITTPEDASEQIDDIVTGRPAEKYIKRNIGKINATSDADLQVPNFENIEFAVSAYKENCKRYRSRLERYSLAEEAPLEINLKLGAHIYSFAALNSDPQYSSISNWKTILPLVLADGGIKDEGTFYTTVNQTIELLSQMADVCQEAKTQCDRHKLEGKKYYDTLSKRLKTAILLLKQKPVRDNNIQL